MTARVPGHTGTVLIIDDEATHRLMTRDCLEDEGYAVLEANDGDLGVQMLRQQHVDVVLLDLMMPGRDGYSICDEIKSDPELQHVAVIMVTGSEDLDAVHRAFAARADDFVTKPVHWKLLPYRVRFTARSLQTSNALRLALVRARAADEAKAEFLAAMGHELRTPLNAIIGFSEVLAKTSLGTTTSGKYLEYAGYIHGSGHRLLSIINAILDMLKLQEGKLVLELQPVDLASLLDHSRQELKHLCDRHGHKFTLRIDNGLPTLNADPRRLMQIVENLVTNAVTFTPSGGSVDIVAQHLKGGGAEIIVTDSGIGMSASDLQLALQPFRQVDGRLERTHEGAGLGLPIAKALAELHGGSLDVQTAPNCGTSITVRLPAVAAGVKQRA